MTMIAQWMRTFVAVADSASFSIAAGRMGITQSTVSKQIVALEGHLRARLFNRTTRSLTLTAEGSAFYEAALRALAAIDEAEASIGNGGEAHGLLRVTMPLSLAEARLIPIMAEFLAQYPRIQIDLRVSDHSLNLVADNIDVAIRVGDLVDSGLVVRKIGVARRVLVATPAYLDEAGRPTTPAQLADHNCLSYSLARVGPRWRFAAGEHVEAAGNFRADSPSALRAAALAGIGIVANAAWLFEADIARGALEVVMPHCPPEPMPIHAVLPSGRHVAARTRLFIDHIAAALARDPLTAI